MTAETIRRQELFRGKIEENNITMTGLKDAQGSWKKKSDTGGEPHLHTEVSGSQKRSLQEDVVNNTKFMVISEKCFSEVVGGEMCSTSRGEKSEKRRDKIRRHSFKKYNRWRKERMNWIIYYVYSLTLLSKNLNSDHTFIFLVRNLAVE